MKKLDIRIYPDPILKELALEITSFDQQLQELAEQMLHTMYQADGIGLAANQVGILKRIAVIDCSEDQSQQLVLINPKITNTQGKVSSHEGCLSIPGYRESIQRHKEVTVQAQDTSGKEFEVKADGLLALALQHEIDHLDGVLFVDRLSRLKKQLFKRWLNKQVQE